MGKLLRSFDLPSFWHGFVTSIDLFEERPAFLDERTSRFSFTTDGLSRDWISVGNDLRSAMKTYSSSKASNERESR